MDAENPTSLRRLLLRMAATLLALVGLYVLGAGPAIYIYVKFPRSMPFVLELYEPLFWEVSQTPLAGLFESYVIWWQNLARPYGHPGKSSSFSPPGCLLAVKTKAAPAGGGRKPAVARGGRAV